VDASMAGKFGCESMEGYGREVMTKVRVCAPCAGYREAFSANWR